MVDLNDLLSFSPALHGLITEKPDEYIPILESAAREVALQVTAASKEDMEDKGNEIQIQLKNYPRITQIRNLAADHVGKVSTCRHST